MTSCHSSQRRTRVLCGALAIVIFAISAYVFSGFHKHEPRSTKVCSFAHFEHPSSVEASGHVDVRPPEAGLWQPQDAAIARPQFHRGARASGRAPPFQS